MKLTDIKGLKQARLKLLEGIGISDVQALLNFLPKKYYDLRQYTPVSGKTPGDMVFCAARITALYPQNYQYKKYVYADADSQFGALRLLWFNSPYALAKLKKGDKIVLMGSSARSFGGFKGQTVINPIIEMADSVNRLQGVMPEYALPPGISQNMFVGFLHEALKKTVFTSVVPEEIASDFGLDTLQNAYRQTHFPHSPQQGENASNRIIIELLVRRYLAFYVQNTEFCAREKPHRYLTDQRELFLQQFLKCLPYTLTDAQTTALKEIFADMECRQPANRLLAGDVGSGKTVVALAAAYYAAKSGGQAVFMAPTELLAAQHCKTCGETLQKLGISTVFLSGSLSADDRKKALDDIKSGRAAVIFATHSAISYDVEFSALYLAVCDEQQRFGVGERKRLMQKGINPDMLFLSATPVPRTLGLALFGEIKTSYIAQKPFASKVKTYLVPRQKTQDMFVFIAKIAREGEQVYIVCPHIDGGKSSVLQDDGQDFAQKNNKSTQNTQFFEQSEDIFAVEPLYKVLKKTHFADISVRKLHGKMSAQQKQTAMQEFAAGKASIMISTTLVEVGIDIKNASVIAVMDADRYGLSQLHQLRGRVGRGGGEGHCFLVYGDYTPKAQQRLTALKQTDDGLQLAHKDLEIRGAGDFLNSRQHGTGMFAGGRKVCGDMLQDALAIYRRIIQSGFAPQALQKLPKDSCGEVCGDIVLN